MQRKIKRKLPPCVWNSDYSCCAKLSYI